MPADNGVANGQSVGVFTQASSAHGGATGAGNTVDTNGIGATCNIAAFEDGAVKPGISTRAFVGGGTGAASSITLSPEKNDVDFVSSSCITQVEQILTSRVIYTLRRMVDLTKAT